MPLPDNSHPPRAENRANAHRSRDRGLTIDPTTLLLGRLESVRRCGTGHIARCPAHDDRTASLSINTGEDGRVLLNCFAGCAAADVVAAIGLELADLFVRKPLSEMSHADRSALREQAKRSQWRAALNVVDVETMVVQIAAHDLSERRPLAPSDYDRLILAASRIDLAASILVNREKWRPDSTYSPTRLRDRKAATVAELRRQFDAAATELAKAESDARVPT